MTNIFGDKVINTTVVDVAGATVNLDVKNTEDLLRESKLTLDLIKTHLELMTDHELKEKDITEA